MKFGEAAAVVMVVAGCMMTVLGGGGTGQPCYFLQRSGCTTNGFCKKDQVVCDDGYSSTTQTVHRGRRGPLDGNQSRKCYKIEGDTITSACNAATPSGYEPTYCRNSAGVCCYTKFLREITSPGGSMTTPSGPECDFGTVQ